MDPIAGLAVLDLVPRVWGLAPYPRGSSFGPRLASDWEWVWIEDGSAVWCVDGAEHRLDPGCACLVRPGVHDLFRWEGRHGVRHGFVHFSLSAPAESVPAVAPVLPPDGILVPLLRHSLDALGGGERTLAAHGLRQALLVAVSAGLAAARPATGDPLVVAVLDQVRARWADGPCHAIPIGALCRLAGLGRAQLSRRFRAALGQGPSQAVRRLRLERAGALLLRTDLDLAEIATLTGFADAFHLSHAFSAGMGMSPRRWRSQRA